MPVCKFFLEGVCTREDCPYLHTKVLKAFFTRFAPIVSPRCLLKLQYVPPFFVVIVLMDLIVDRGD